MSEPVADDTVSATDIDPTFGIPYGTPVPPPTISMADILAATELVAKKEEEDRTALNGISAIPFDTLKSTLIRWAAIGFPNAYVIYEVPITPPTVCSDGVARTLEDYISFVSGKTIREHVAALQERVIDFTVSFAFNGTTILIVVSK